MSIFIGYTTGLECWTKAGIKMLSVQSERQSNGTVRVSIVSGRNLVQLKTYGTKTLSASEWENRPADPYDSTVEAIWALELFNLRPAALEHDE